MCLRNRKSLKIKLYEFSCVAEYRYNMVEENFFLAKIILYVCLFRIST